MLEFRLKAYRRWLENERAPLGERHHILRSTIKTSAYYSAPKKKPKLNSLDEVDPEVLQNF